MCACGVEVGGSGDLGDESRRRVGGEIGEGGACKSVGVCVFLIPIDSVKL